MGELSFIGNVATFGVGLVLWIFFFPSVTCGSLNLLFSVEALSKSKFVS